MSTVHPHLSIGFGRLMAMALLVGASLVQCQASHAQDFPEPGVECVPSPYGCPGERGGGVSSHGGIEEDYAPPTTEPLSAAQRAGVQNNEAVRFYVRGDFAGAVKRLRKALALDPGNRTIRGNLALAEGVWLSVRGNFSGAMEKYREAIEINPGNEKVVHREMARTVNSEGAALLERGDYQNAKQKYEEALTYNPSNNVARSNLLHVEGYFLSREGDNAGAMQKYQEAIAVNPDNRKAIQGDMAAASKAQADIAMKRGDVDEAAKKYCETINLDSRYERVMQKIRAWVEKRGKRLSVRQGNVVCSIRG